MQSQLLELRRTEPKGIAPLGETCRLRGHRYHDAHQAIALLERQRAQHYRVHHTEDGGVRTDAERERQDRNGGKTWRAAKTAHAVLYIIDGVFQPAERARVAMQLLRQSDAAHGPARGKARILA